MPDRIAQATALETLVLPVTAGINCDRYGGVDEILDRLPTTLTRLDYMCPRWSEFRSLGLLLDSRSRFGGTCTGLLELNLSYDGATSQFLHGAAAYTAACLTSLRCLRRLSLTVAENISLLPFLRSSSSSTLTHLSLSTGVAAYDDLPTLLVEQAPALAPTLRSLEWHLRTTRQSLLSLCEWPRFFQHYRALDRFEFSCSHDDCYLLFHRYCATRKRAYLDNGFYESRTKIIVSKLVGQRGRGVYLPMAWHDGRAIVSEQPPTAAAPSDMVIERRRDPDQYWLSRKNGGECIGVEPRASFLTLPMGVVVDAFLAHFCPEQRQ